MLAAGCGFEGSATVDALRVDTSIIDSSGDAATDAAAEHDAPGSTCPWSFPPTYATPCPTAPIGAAVELVTGGTYTYNTDTDALIPPMGGTAPSLMTTTNNGVRTIWTSGFRVGPGVTLRAIGTVPLAVISTGTIMIEGTVDVGSHQTGSTISSGAGADPASCPSAPPDAGEQCANHGGSGGGGGAFGGAGGRGGDGGGGRGNACGSDGGNDSVGGAGGVAVSPIPATLRGGCGGKIGGNNTDPGSLGGAAGPGGGAIVMVARASITVADTGVIRAGGAGGGPGIVKRAGGGGGGSGGMIVLEAVAITVSGAVAANGGGGGGGCEMATASPGDDGRADDQVATGGAPEGNGTSGGAGGAASTRGGTSAANADRGGGGGGGGAGFIHLNASSLSTPGKISPPAS